MARIDALKNEFSSVNDPRIEKNKKHPLVGILAMSICAIIAGADGPTDIKDWSKSNVDWLKQFLDLPYGIPSKDTFLRVLARIDAQEFQDCFIKWVKGTFTQSSKIDESRTKTIAIDGKTLRRSGSPLHDILPVHIVSAWCNELGISLGQMTTKEKSNEITAIPELLDSIDIFGDIVTIDAMGCQTAIAKKIVDKKGDYILQVKGNQKTLCQELVATFDDSVGSRTVDADVRQHVTYDEAHGREETRYHYMTVITPETPIAGSWPGAKAIGMVIRETAGGNGRRSCEKSYYILSRMHSVKQFAKSVRAHWSVESQHWLLDVVFDEDEHRTREVNLASNLSMLRRFSIGLLKKVPDKMSIKRRRKMCGWQTDYLEKVLEIQG